MPRKPETMPHPTSTFPDVSYLRTEVTTTPPGSWARRAGWITLGGAVGCGIGSAISAVMARDSYDVFVHRIATEGAWDPRQISQVENYRLSTNLLLAGAVAAGAVGVLLLWLSDSSTPPRISFAPGAQSTFTVSF